MQIGVSTMLVVFGPTTTGKTSLAIKLAEQFNGEIISADSRQVYQKLDIGSGKVSFKSNVKKHEGYWIVDGVKINGFDIAKVGDNFTAADFISFAQAKINQIQKTNKLPIVVGGSGFYIKGLLEGIDTIGIPANWKLRKKLEKLTVKELFEKLKKLNFDRAIKMNNSDRVNPRRLIRAIEIASSTVKQSNSKIIETNNFIIGLTAPNNVIYKKADMWLEERFKNGMVDEIKNLISTGSDIKWLQGLGLEYKWITRYVKGEIDKEETISRLQGDIHKLIRHQKTWFKKYPQIKIYDVTKKNWQNQIEKEIGLWYNQLDVRY